MGDQLVQRGFVVEEGGRLRGRLTDGLLAPADVAIDLVDPFPFVPPKVLPLGVPNVPSWHRDRTGHLCLYNSFDSGDLPWLDVDAFLARIRDWFRQETEGWVHDVPLLELERYLPLAPEPALLMLASDYEHGQRIHFRALYPRVVDGELRSEEHNWAQQLLKGWPPGVRARRGTRKGGPVKVARHGYFIEIGEVERPFATWPQFISHLDPQETARFESEVGARQLDFLVARYSRMGEVGHVALSTTLKEGEIDVGYIQLTEVSEAALNLRSGPDRPALRNRSVTVVGVGAIGSFVADLLARAGVRRFCLVDPELLIPGNSVRHLIGEPGWGRWKADAVRRHLEATYPGIEVEVDLSSVTSFAEAAARFGRSDLVVDSTASDTCSLLLGHQARELGLPLLVVACQRAGMVARVDRYPISAGEDHGPPVLALGSEPEPLIATGCGEPVSPTPPHAVLFAAAAACEAAIRLLRGEHVPPTVVHQLTPQSDLFPSGR